ncbi:integral membrane protein GPR180-like [Ptychodera flava]|uniref:integral membrane protein GPR180-like n=1 Tax=Ptychodera flava TaxID=63121 RepID=UPI00396A73BD
MKSDQKFFLLAIACYYSSTVLSKTVTGTFNSVQAETTYGQYVTKFCFHGETAEVQYELNSTGKDGKLYFFLDEHWHSANSQNNCWDKLKLARITHELKEVTGNQTLAHFISPKTWHIVYADIHTCKDKGSPISEPITVRYKLVLLNPDTLGNPTSHFSDEETGLLGFYQILVIAYFVLLCIFSSEVYHAITKGGPMYLVLKMLSIGMVLQSSGIFFMFLHLYGYSKDGIGSPLLEFTSEFLDICAHFQMLYLLINLSLGWTLGSSKVHHLQENHWKSRPVIPVALFLSVYQGILLMWELLEGSEHKVYNAYQNTAGVLLIIIRILLAVIFTGNLYNTVSIERSALRREFYKNFAKSCLIWFLCYPIMVITSLVFANYIRYKLITIGVRSAQSISMILLYKLFLSRSLYWEVSALSATTMPLRMDKTFGIKLYS